MSLEHAPTTELRDRIRETAHPITGDLHDYDWLMRLIGDKRIVLLGEASHGTHEFYRERVRITQRLVEEKGFTAVAVEADWPDAYRVNRFVQGRADDAEAIDALGGFRRFPAWMWRNADVLDFVGWLRAHNDATPLEKVGFYGLDLYSLHASAAAVLAYLEKVDPENAALARKRYACFDHLRDDGHEYGYRTAYGLRESCEKAAVAQLLDLRRRAAEYAHRSGTVEKDEFFYTEQNARLVKNAEAYYRSMFLDQVGSWNVRDRHMAETLDALLSYLDRSSRATKIVVWEHNSHIGDARATGMAGEGELNLGQLVREAHPSETVLAGFTTYTGTVTAASDWDAPAERMHIRPGLVGSYEAVLHHATIPAFALDFTRIDEPARVGLCRPRLERAIGVVYRPETERQSHYFDARLPDQFDAIIHLDTTRAVEPLERTAEWTAGEPPETFPSAL
jgi:erythromycin esterase-like protein